MLIDQTIQLANQLGVPHYDIITCTPFQSRADRILARVETLLLTDPVGTLGERLRAAAAKVNQ